MPWRFIHFPQKRVATHKENSGDKMYPHEPLTTLFNDFNSHEAEHYANQFSWQLATYVGSIHVSYCAWRDIPSVYLCCTQDNMIPLDFQYQIAAMAGAETESCDAGHMVVLSQPDKVVEVVLKAAGNM